MSGISIFLDDERLPEDVKWINLPKKHWYVVNTPQAFQHLVISVYENYGHIDCISFDHDLGYGMETGYDLIKWLTEFIMDHKMGFPNRVFFHTQNPVGKRNMEIYYRNFINNVEV